MGLVWRMTLPNGWLRLALEALLRWYRKRLGDTVAAARKSPQGGSDAVWEAVYEVTEDARRKAWAISSAYLRGEARRLGGDELWLPDVPEYSPKAVQATVRRIPDPVGAGWEKTRAALERHVLASARRTVVDAVEEAPLDAELLTDLRELADDLEDWPERDRDAAVRDVEDHERGGEGDPVDDAAPGSDDKKKPKKGKKKKTKKKRKRKSAGEDIIDAILDRIDKADKELKDAQLHDEHSKEALTEDVPANRRDAKGRRIVRPFAWARVVNPTKNGPCGFCAMLASRGPVYTSARAAGVGVDKFHDNCACEIVAVFTSKAWEGKEASAEYARIYDEVVRKQGLTGSHARTAMDLALRGNRPHKAKKEKE